MANVSQTALNSNGHNGHAYPVSRKVFNRTLPRQLEMLEQRIEHLESRAAAIEIKIAASACDAAPAVRVDNIVEIAGRLAERLKRVDKRASRSRRSLAVIADQVEVRLY
jgi:hypothetical protein